MKKKVTMLTISMVVLTILVGLQNTANATVISKLIANGFSKRLFIGLIICNVSFAVLDTARDAAGRKASSTVYFDLKTRLTEKSAWSETKSINKISVGTIIDSINKISEYTGQRYVTIVSCFSCILPMAIMIWKIRTSIASIAILFSCFVLSSAMYLWGNEKFKFNENEHKAAAKLESVLVDGLENLLTLKYASKFSYLFNRVTDAADDSYKYSTNTKKRAWFGLCQAVSYVPVCFIAYFFRWDVETLGYVFINEYVIYNSIFKCIDIVAYTSKIKAATKQIEALEGNDNDEKVSMPSQFTVSGSFDYGKDSAQFTVNNISIRRCERYLITGASGEGKSSFGNLIAGAIKSEEIFGLPENLDTYYVFQETTLLNDSLRNNVTFGDETVTDEEIIKIFEELDMLNDLRNTFRVEGVPVEIDKLLDCPVGSKGFNLSTGLKQRVLLTRTVVEMRRNPNKIFILDEVTSNLDDRNRNRAIDLINRECHSTLMVISHNEGFDKICSNHIVVKNHVVAMQ